MVSDKTTNAISLLAGDVFCGVTYSSYLSETVDLVENLKQFHRFCGLLGFDSRESRRIFRARILDLVCSLLCSCRAVLHILKAININIY
jgi:hypothetical protein